MRFRTNGSSQHFVGSGGGISLGDNEDLSMRAYDNIRIATGNNSTERVRITSAGHAFYTQSVGIQTNNIDGANISNPVGAGHSLVGLYIGDGSLLFSSALSRSGGYYISTDINALNAGPVTLNSNMKLDGTWVIVSVSYTHLTLPTIYSV